MIRLLSRLNIVFRIALMGLIGLFGAGMLMSVFFYWSKTGLMDRSLFIYC